MKKFEIRVSDKPNYGGFDVIKWTNRNHKNPDGLFVANNDNNLFCLPSSLSALQANYQKPVLPGKEKFFSELTYTWLQQVYDKIYPDDEIEFVPR